MRLTYPLTFLLFIRYMPIVQGYPFYDCYLTWTQITLILVLFSDSSQLNIILTDQIADLMILSVTGLTLKCPSQLLICFDK